MEFVDYRPYFPGDDLRRVDWNVAARSDRLVVKEYVKESGLPIHLLIDVSRSMGVGEPSALEAARRMARGFAYVALSHGDLVTVAGVGESVGGRVRVTAKSALPRVERFLADLAPTSQTDLGRSLRAYAYSANEAGVAVVLSDLLDPNGFESGLRSLVARKFETVVIHLVTPQMMTPDIPRDALITDAESGATREITWNDDARRAYESRRDAFFDHAATWCAERRIRYARCRTETPLLDVFFKELRRARILV